MQQSFAMFPSPGAFQQPLQQPLNTTTLDYQQPLNFTILDCIVPNALHLPIYYTNRPSLLSFISDKYLALAGPILIYWVVALGFHTLDTAKIPYFEAKRLHESPEVLSRNKATVLEVLKAVFWQQVIQIIMALVALDDDETIAKRENGRGHLGEMERIAPWVADVTLVVLGRRSGEDLLRRHGESMVRWVYWWGIPAAQMFFAFFILDLWQYVWHRVFHTPFLYRHIHSVHHRLYVPYAFGALYNHPIEGFFFDTLGAVVAQEAARMSTRQALLLFSICTVKTLDDHSGYKLWWDPCQFIFSNNSDYHDIHHQVYGIKSNFSQPFFTSWDKLLGTQMSREQAATKTRRPARLD